MTSQNDPKGGGKQSSGQDDNRQPEPSRAPRISPDKTTQGIAKKPKDEDVSERR